MLYYLNKMRNDYHDTRSEQTNETKPMTKIHNTLDVFDIFTDGSEIKHSTTHKTLAVGWSYLINKNKTLLVELSGCISDVKLGNNQRAELMAITQALREMERIVVNTQNPSHVTIYTDSEYSMKALTIWCHTWKHNGWKTSNKKPVKHKDLIEQSMHCMLNIKKGGNSLSIVHVRAHTDKKDYISLGNSRADVLALSAAKLMLKEQDNKI